ncbi:MAG: hypothetical protein JRM73_01640 [Nitrososphaerota archaeon]|nr:hypothetical protein [Nitrososphaerota archaeon]
MSKEVPAFDFRRWGPGGIVVIGAFFVLGLVGMAEGALRGSIFFEVLGAICLGGGIVTFAVKIGEEIHPVTAKWGIDGEVGEVVEDVDRDTKGVVLVRSELWSAKSEGLIRVGEKIRVVKVEGLVAWVVRADAAVDRSAP